MLERVLSQSLQSRLNVLFEQPQSYLLGAAVWNLHQLGMDQQRIGKVVSACVGFCSIVLAKCLHDFYGTFGVCQQSQINEEPANVIPGMKCCGLRPKVLNQ